MTLEMNLDEIFNLPDWTIKNSLNVDTILLRTFLLIHALGDTFHFSSEFLGSLLVSSEFLAVGEVDAVNTLEDTHVLLHALHWIDLL